MLLIAGLGNPGSKYERHRHNIGFMALDEIAARHGFPAWQKKHQALVSEARLGDTRVLLMKPQTFMNESGRAVASAARFYKIPVGQIIVLHDELDVAPGRIKMKTGGGHAGHNGLRSIHAQMSSDAYRRMRLGIGHPGDKSRVHGYVLGDFSKADQVWLRPLLESIADHMQALVAGRDGDFVSKVMQDVPSDRSRTRGRPDKVADKSADPKPKRVVKKVVAEDVAETSNDPQSLLARLREKLIGGHG